MSFLEQIEIDGFKNKLTSDVSYLGKLYKAKKSKYYVKSVDHSMADEYINKGWEIERELKTKTRIRKAKPHNKQFEDDVWCQFYNLGYRYLNYDDNCFLPFGKNKGDKKQIDVVAVSEDTILIVECKSSSKLKKAPSFKEDFDALSMRLNGFKKVINQAFTRNLKLKYIFATRNLRIELDGSDITRLNSTNSFYYNDNTYDYVNNLIKNYKGAAKYQFLGLIFKNQLINLDKIEVPAVQGVMGGKKYYMFSIEPTLLLKIGFILHRTRANQSEMPTYQRLLVPSRLKGITKFIDEGGFFPNSIILNFNQAKNKILFESSSKSKDSSSKYGTIKIPNAYSIAYIIDGQHRVYGYANSKYKESNTIPVVAFTDLESLEQLEMFMDINQNQKAVSPSLKLTLEEDLFWGSDKADSRLKALKSSIIKELSNSQSSPLFNKISIGEDSSILTFQPFYKALTKSGLLPTAKGNKYIDTGSNTSFYDVNNHNHNNEMLKTKRQIVKFISLCYEYVESNHRDIYEKEKYFILSNRGTYAFICLLGSLNSFTSEEYKFNTSTSPESRFEAIEKYIEALMQEIREVNKEEEEKLLLLMGQGAETFWLRSFQTMINKRFNDYEPIDLIDWRERQNDQLQDEGRKYGVEIERFMKNTVLDTIKSLYEENWELEINSIKRECMKRAEEEMERNYKQKLGKKDVHWTEMFNINDYLTIIKKYWTKIPEDNIKPFQEVFSIDIGEGFNSIADRTKWISKFNSYRNLWAHEGTKEKRLNKEEVGFLEGIHKELIKKN